MSRSQATCQIQFGKMPQLAEAVDPDDDWTGLTDAALRRKRQNRLNVRAYRRRKARESQILHTTTSSGSRAGFRARVPCWDEKQQAVLNLPIGVITPIHHNRMSPLIPPPPGPTKSDGIVFPLASDHLITLLQFNVLRGSLANRELLSRLEPNSTPHQECSDAALHVLPDPNASTLQSLPQSLHPTVLQRTIPHEAWIDIIPHPRLRDNCIRAMGTFNEDQLWSDTIGGLFEGFPDSEIEHRGVIMWSPPWSTSGWEFSEGFWRKWRWLLKGCGDVLDATNYWRERRSEEPLVFEVGD